MDSLLAARSQMAMSLAFHIVFAAIGMAMPLLMVIAEARGCARAIGSISSSRSAGPRAPRSCSRSARCRAPCCRSSSACCGRGSWRCAGPIIGMPFSLEGFAFFLEAIFLGIYLYGWDRVPPRAHLLAGRRSCAVERRAVRHVRRHRERVDEHADRLPARRRPGSSTSIRSRRCSTRRAVPQVAAHAARRLLRRRRSRSPASTRCMLLRDPTQRVPPARAGDRAARSAASPALLQPLSRRPVGASTSPSTSRSKLAAMEGHFATEQRRAAAHRRHARRRRARRRATRSRFPAACSLLAFGDPTRDGARPERRSRATSWPPVRRRARRVPDHGRRRHCAARVSALLARRGCCVAPAAVPTRARFLRALVAAAPLGFIAIEAGWMVTEVGRQPWIVCGVHAHRRRGHADAGPRRCRSSAVHAASTSCSGGAWSRRADRGRRPVRPTRPRREDAVP